MAPGRRAVVLVAMVVLAAIVEAAWLAPATLLDAQIARATGQSVRLVDTEGTVWRGRATVAAATARIPMAWDVDVWPLLQGVMRVRMRSGTGAGVPRATIAVRSDGVILRDVDVTIPAEVLAAFLGYPVGSVAGDISAVADDLDLTPGSGRGGVRLAWRGARIANVVGAAPLDLGAVRSAATAGGDAISGPLANEGGDLALVGEWKVHAKEGLALALRLTPRRADQTELKAALSAMGTADGDGWRVDWRVPLR